MKLRRLKLKNFQAHKSLVIDFGQHITTIKGPTDTGKSAILRALRWVCLNSLAGDEFISHGEKLCGVSLDVIHKNEKYLIERVKGRSGSANLYALDAQEFRAFGQDVPDPIKALLRLGPINFQDQHDAPFWFSETAGEVSRKLNAVIDLSVIDTTLSKIASEVRRANEEKSVCADRLKGAQDELTQLDGQRKRITDFKALKAKHETFKEKESAEQRLAGILTLLTNNRRDALKAKAAEGERILTEARKVRSLYIKWQEVVAIEESLARLAERAIRSEQEVSNKRAIFESLSAKINKLRCPTCGQLPS